MFKVGDRVRVLRHRNFFGEEDLRNSGLEPGQIVKLIGISKNCTSDDFVTYITDTSAGWLVRSDDIELIEPVREVTRREIVPGTYGKVRITASGYIHCKSIRTAEELRDAIATLEQVLEAM